MHRLQIEVDEDEKRQIEKEMETLGVSTLRDYLIEIRGVFQWVIQNRLEHRKEIAAIAERQRPFILSNPRIERVFDKAS